MELNPENYKDEGRQSDANKKDNNIVAEFGAENDQLNIKVNGTEHDDIFKKADDINITPPEQIR